ncbi:MAG: outer membrane lipoprotein LolB [Oceanococcaceae bacterium]
MSLFRRGRRVLCRAGAWCGAVLVLSGCAMLAERPAPDRDARDLTAWDLRANVVVRGPTRGRGNLRWQQAGEHFTITVSGPFGAGATRLDGTLDRVRVTRGNDTFDSVEPAQDLARALGMPVPLAQLPRWLRGLAAAPVDGGADPGWVLEVSEWVVVDGYRLPAELALQAGAQALTLTRMRWEVVEVASGQAVR